MCTTLQDGQQPLTFEQSTQQPAVTSSNVFRRRGAMWEIAYGGHEAFYLPPLKGLAYTAFLLRNPSRWFTARELVMAVEKPDVVDVANGLMPNLDGSERLDRDSAYLSFGTAAVSSASSCPTIDVRARRAYEKRADQLRDEISDATEIGDEIKAAELQEELRAIAKELKAVRGKHGKGRLLGGGGERVRKLVRNDLVRAWQHIAKYDATLHRHLRNSVQTGNDCGYLPEQLPLWTL